MLLYTLAINNKTGYF